MLQHPKVLLLSSDLVEADFLQKTLREHAILTCVRNMRELQVLLEGGNYDALFCSWPYHLGTWHDPLTEAQQRYPEMVVIMLSRTAGEQEWREVLEAGAFDLLSPRYEQHASM